MKQSFYDMVEANPVIAAIKDEDGLQKVCTIPEIRVVFVLYGDICSVDTIVKTLHEAGKCVIVHVDLVNGLAPKEIAVDFIRKQTKADGIISTKPALIRRAKELSMFTVMRFFILDSMALDSIEKQLSGVRPDFLEILPGIMPRVTKEACTRFRVHVIAGGLISSRQDIIDALNAGAMAVSSTNQAVWRL